MTDILKKLFRGKYYYTDEDGTRFVFMRKMAPVYLLDDDSINELESHGFTNLSNCKENRYKVTVTYKGKKKVIPILANNENDAIDEVKDMMINSFHLDKDKVEENVFEVCHSEESLEEEDMKFQGKVTLLLSDDTVKTRFINEPSGISTIIDSISEVVPGGEFHNGDALLFDGSAYQCPCYAMRYESEHGFRII